MRGSAAFRTSVTPGGALAGPWVRNELSRRARAVPSLDLRFADNKSLVDATTGQKLVTFTRASSGTYVGSDGLIKTATNNEARFDHNPTTGESLGLLVEESRTNLLLRSEEFDDASWTKQSSVSVSANAVTAPNGTLTADTVTADSGLGVFQNITSVIGLNYVNSVYVKAGTATSLLLRDDTGAGRHIQFNPSTGQITATAGTLVGFGSQAVGNDWFRVWMIYAADSTTARGIIRPGSSGSAQTFTVWGAQLEAGAFPTSYIPTTTATVTRSADVASITGTAFSSWYRQDEGTVFANWSYPVTPSSFPRIWQFTEGAAGTENSFSVSTNFANHNRFGARAQNVGLFDLQQGPDATVGQSMRSAMALRAGQHAYSGNSTAPSTNTGAMPSGIDRCWIGSLNGSLYLTGHIRRLTYWPQRLPNETLQAVTQ
jgi:hypothetical protein